MKFPEVKCRCGKTVRPKGSHASVKMFGNMPSYRGVQYECPLCGEKSIEEKPEAVEPEHFGPDEKTPAEARAGLKALFQIFRMWM